MEEGRCDVVLPDDLAFGILVWLPVMSLLRFKSVCKSWFALIESSPFITAHHANVKDDDNDIGTFIYKFEQTWKLMSCSSSGHEDGFRDDGEKDDAEEDKYKIEILDIDLKNFNQNGEEGNGARFTRDHLVIAGCYHGLILLHEIRQIEYPIECQIEYPIEFGAIALWNTATRQVRQLPESHAPIEKEFYQAYNILLGFGFDSKTNDYKVVKISSDLIMDLKAPKAVIEVYSLSTNSWRIIQSLPPVDVLRFQSSLKQPYLDRFLCWEGISRDVNGNASAELMVFFDLNDELFTTLPLPDVATNRHVNLAFLSGKVACFIGICDHYQLWVLNEYGVKESWIKLCSIPTVYLDLDNSSMRCMAPPNALSKNGDFIFLSTSQRFYMFDPETQEIDDLQVRADAFSHLVLYKESLVTIQSSKDAADNTQF